MIFCLFQPFNCILCLFLSLSKSFSQPPTYFNNLRIIRTYVLLFYSKELWTTVCPQLSRRTLYCVKIFITITLNTLLFLPLLNSGISINIKYKAIKRSCGKSKQDFAAAPFVLAMLVRKQIWKCMRYLKISYWQ